jgi:hypothetical protein
MVPEDRHVFLACLRLCQSSRGLLSTDALETVSQIEHVTRGHAGYFEPQTERYGERSKETDSVHASVVDDPS